jgi:hypothetical protein
VAIRDRLVGDLGRELGERDRRAARHGLLGGERAGAGGDDLVPLAARHDVVDQAPVLGALALDALGGGAEHVGAVAADLALVDEAGQPAGAGQDGEQRGLGERHRRVAVVDQDRLVARQRELVAAAGGGSLARAQRRQPRARRRVLEVEPGLVGELAEVDLERVARQPEHVDVGARAEHAIELGGDHQDLDLGVLEAQPLDRVGELEVDREVVRVELELVARAMRVIAVDRHDQRRGVAATPSFQCR